MMRVALVQTAEVCQSAPPGWRSLVRRSPMNADHPQDQIGTAKSIASSGMPQRARVGSVTFALVLIRRTVLPVALRVPVLGNPTALNDFMRARAWVMKKPALGELGNMVVDSYAAHVYGTFTCRITLSFCRRERSCPTCRREIRRCLARRFARAGLAKRRDCIRADVRVDLDLCCGCIARGDRLSAKRRCQLFGAMRTPSLVRRPALLFRPG